MTLWRQTSASSVVLRGPQPREKRNAMVPIRRYIGLVLLSISLGSGLGCERQTAERDSAKTPGAHEVVVYTALDRRFSEPILNAFAAKTPVRSAPSVPPIPWTPKASRESSYPNFRLTLVAA